MLNPNDFRQAIQTIDGLGTTPAVLVKVAEIAPDPNTEIETLGALLRNDGPLVADIIRISNSPYYAPATFHSNLSAAIHFIGLREVIRVVKLSLARQFFARDLTCYGITAFDYWSDSVAAALVMEALAKHSGLNPEDAHTLGILHALGRVLINRVLEEKSVALCWDGRQPIEEWERGVVGFDFAQAGAMLLKHWQFPTPMCSVIRWQLHAEKVADPVSLLGALQFTRSLLALTGSSFKHQNWPFPAHHPYVQASGLTPLQLDHLLSACQNDFRSLLQTIDVK